MKKFRNLRLFVFASVFLFVLSLIVFNYAQSQVEIQKGKPPGKGKPGGGYTWSAVILDEPENGVGLQGLDPARYVVADNWTGWIYEDSEPNINVNVSCKGYPGGGETIYRSNFTLEIFNPVQVWLYLDPYQPWWYEDVPFPQNQFPQLSKYPGIDDSTDPWNMFNHMQISPQPAPEYHRFWITFRTEWSVNQSDVDYEQWAYHGHMGFYARILGPPKNIDPRVLCEDRILFEYSSIEFSSALDYGYFKRIDNDTWRVFVGQEEGSPDFYNGQGELGVDDGVAYDNYDVCVPNQYHKKKTGSDILAIPSARGQFDIKFVILFIRTKQ